MKITMENKQLAGSAHISGQSGRTPYSIKGMLLCASLALMLAACGGGKDSQRNPGGNNKEELGASIATAQNKDILAFENNVWKELRASDKGCGDCHRPDVNSPQQPYFVDNDVNEAYDVVVSKGLANTSSPADSKLVDKVGPKGHNCWATKEKCASDMTAYIEAWANGYVKGSSSREITLSPIPEEQQKVIGDDLLFPPTYPSGYQPVHNLLTQYCSGCHRSDGPQQQQLPYFAVTDIQDSYDAAKIKIDLNNPANSELVQRLQLEHNCWDVCSENAAEMQAAIEGLAADIASNNVKLDESAIIISRVLTLLDGVQSSGGNRYEASQIAMYEFKSRGGDTVLDNSGVQPAINLALYGTEGVDYRWLNNWGIEILTSQGRAQGDTASSKKLHNLIKLSGQYSIEAWVIPGNVTQEMANIVSYSVNGESRNFTLGQTMYNYDFFHRSSTTGTGETALSTPNADEVLQATLQHVVVTYDALNGRQIFVNGQSTGVSNPADQGGDLLNWHNSYALILGNDADGDRPWQGTLRMVAIHDRALTPEQIQVNYEAEVGQKYLMPFAVSHIDGMPPESYIVFEVSQYDEFSYLFSTPRYVNLAGNTPTNIDLSGMRLGMNGDEVAVGQAYPNVAIANLADGYSEGQGRMLSNIDTIIELQNGADFDEFFLTFEELADKSRSTDYNENDADPVADRPALPIMTADTMSPDIGVRTFDEINASMAKVTRINDWETVAAINNRDESGGEKLGVYVLYRQQFPAVENIEGFLPSHQMAIAQLALAYCDERVNRDVSMPPGPARYFQGFDFDAIASVAFTPATISQIVDPLLKQILNAKNLVSDGAPNLSTQPAVSDVRLEINKLINEGEIFAGAPDRIAMTAAACMTDPVPENNCDNVKRTEQIVKATCTAVLGGAAMLIQ